MKNLLSLLFNFLIKPVQTSEEPALIINNNPPKPPCPTCGSHHIVKNGSIHTGQQKYQCKECGRQFVIAPTKQEISCETKQLIDKLLLERISLRGIARVVGVSWSWLPSYVNAKFSSIPRQIEVAAKPKGKLTIECDEMGSLVSSKQNKLYIWLAIIEKLKKLLVVMWEIEVVNLRANFGRVCQVFIDNVRLLTPIFGRHIKQSFPPNAIEQWVNKVVKPIILNGSIILFANGFLD